MDEVNQLKKQLEEANNLIAKKDYDIKLLQSRIPTSTLDGLVITDPNQPDYPIVYVNPVFESITGYSLTEIMGKNCRILQGEDTSQKDLEIIRQALSQRKECRVTIKNYRKDKKVFWNELTLSPSFDNNNKLISYIGIIHDVTTAKEIDRMKTEFISIASHQLRTPLSAIKWFCELLFQQKAGNLNKQQLEYLGYISASIERLITLVNSLLNVSRIESGRMMIQPTPVNLKELLTTIEQDLHLMMAQRQLDYQLTYDENIPIVELDQNLIRQVYLNLLTNAIKYTPIKGTIKVNIYLKDDEIISQVSDNGLGIPQKNYQQVFQKFFRADNVKTRATDGNGLGLYLVKSIVEISGGKIWFESEENKGTTFYFTLPIKHR